MAPLGVVFSPGDVVGEDRAVEFVYGTPDQVIERVEAMRERFPLDRLALRFHHSGLPAEVVEEQIRLFGEAVVPAFGN